MTNGRDICEFSQARLSALMDRALPPDEMSRARHHVDGCPACSRALDELIEGRSAVRGLWARRVPCDLTTRLLVAASQHCEITRRWASWKGFSAFVQDRASLSFNNLMRPFAIPFAGGLMTASLVFAFFVSHYPMADRSIMRDDVPTPLYTEAELKNMGTMSFAEEELMVNVVIDGQGRVVQYTFEGPTPGVAPGVKDIAMRREIEHTLLFTEFKPATAFGQPVSGRLRILFRRGHIDVKG